MQNTLRLGVNIDHVATLRQARGTRYPDPVQAAIAAEQAGADGITLHLREDRRHIQERDVHLLKEILQTRMNLEMAPTEAMVVFAERVRPEACCLVPERRAELTTEGGLDVIGNSEWLQAVCERLQAVGIEVSLFIDPDVQQIAASRACGASVVEIHTGQYADAVQPQEVQDTYDVICDAVGYAKQLGLQVNAGHGLHYHNVQAIAALPELTELNIGHSIVARALFVGFAAAVTEMKQLLWQARYSCHP